MGAGSSGPPEDVRELVDKKINKASAYVASQERVKELLVEWDNVILPYAKVYPTRGGVNRIDPLMSSSYNI